MASPEAPRPWWIKPAIGAFALGAIVTNPNTSAAFVRTIVTGFGDFAGAVLPDVDLPADAITTEPGNPIPSPGDVTP